MNPTATSSSAHHSLGFAAGPTLRTSAARRQLCTSGTPVVEGAQQQEAEEAALAWRAALRKAARGGDGDTGPGGGMGGGGGVGD